MLTRFCDKKVTGDLGENNVMESQGKKTNQSWLRSVGGEEVDAVSVNKLVMKLGCVGGER